MYISAQDQSLQLQFISFISLDEVPGCLQITGSPAAWKDAAWHLTAEATNFGAQKRIIGS